MKDNKEKIEFWLHTNQKNALKAISDETGYSVSELMRRGVEYIIKDLAPYYNLKVNNTYPTQNKEEDTNHV
jgi:predicted DNA-binding protein